MMVFTSVNLIRFFSKVDEDNKRDIIEVLNNLQTMGLKKIV